jgi:hypothetical protein
LPILYSNTRRSDFLIAFNRFGLSGENRTSRVFISYHQPVRPPTVEKRVRSGAGPSAVRPNPMAIT